MAAGGAQLARADEGQVSGRGAGWGLPSLPAAALALLTPQPRASALVACLTQKPPPVQTLGPSSGPRSALGAGLWGREGQELGWGWGGYERAWSPRIHGAGSRPGARELTLVTVSMKVASHSRPRNTPAAFTARPRQVRPQGALTCIVSGQCRLSGDSR